MAYHHEAGYLKDAVEPATEQLNTLAAAEDALARLDERLATSPIANAFHQRTHVLDAAAALYCEGDLVHLEDLVLHDAAADAHAPTVAVTRAHKILRTRRHLAAAPPGWALSPHGFDILRGARTTAEAASERLAASAFIAPAADAIAIEEDAFEAELADIDALIARSTRVLAGEPAPAPSAAPPQRAAPADIEIQDRLVDRLAAWREVLTATQNHPPVLAAARALAAFDALAPVPDAAWLGYLAAADLLRARGKTRHHLAALNLGQKLARRDAAGRRPRDDAGRLTAAIACITRAAEAGLADHDRWCLLRQQLERKLVGRRSTSKMPELIGLVLRAPVVSTQTIAQELKISPRAALDLVAALGLRELSGRTRYRCWGII